MRLSALVESSDGSLVPVAGPIAGPVAGPVAGRAAGPAAADPEVTAVVTTDLLDPRRYLAGGELVLTGLAWWRPGEPARSRAFVVALTQVGVAALAAGGAELGGVPDDLVGACERAGLPLLRVPVAVSFATVTERAGRHLSPRRSDDLAAELGRHRALLAAGGDEAAGLAAVLDWVAADLGLPCWVLAPTGRLVGGVDPAPDERERHLLARRYLRAERLPHRVARANGRTVSLFGTGDATAAGAGPVGAGPVGAGPVGAGPVRAGSWVVAVGEDHRGWTEARTGVIDELVSLIALERELSGRRAEAEHQLAAALCRDSAGEVTAAACRCGLDPDAPLVVMVGIGRYAPVVLAEALPGWPAPCALGESGGVSIAVVAGVEPAGLVAGVRGVLASLAAGLGPEPLHIGVGDAVTGGDGLLGAVAGARSAAGAGRAVGPHSVCGPEVLSSHPVLLAAVPGELRRAFRDRVLGAVLAHDRTHRTELVRTLEAYLDCSGSWSRCAARMHVHVNTLRYRIERIEQLTGRDLRRLADQADLLLALHASRSP